MKTMRGRRPRDDNDVNPGILWSRGRCMASPLRGLDPFRCDLKCPREDKREGEADDNHGNDQSDDQPEHRTLETPEHSLRQRPPATI